MTIIRSCKLFLRARVAGTSTKSARRFALSEAKGDTRGMILETASFLLSTQDGLQTLRDTLGNTELTADELLMASAAAAAGWAIENPTDAISFIHSNVTETEFREHLLRVAYTNWATRNPTQAVEALQQDSNVLQHSGILSEMA